MRRELRLRERYTRWVPGDPNAVMDRVREGVFAHALDEDVMHRLLPLAGRARFALSTTPDSAEARNTVTNALGWESDRYRNDLEDVAWEFFRKCAQYVMEFGQVVWEVCPYETEGVALVFVQPDTLQRRWFRTAQLVVEEDGRRHAITIPEGRLVRVHTPETRRLRRARNLLAGPGFSHAALSPLITGQQSYPISVSEISRTEDLALAQVGLVCDWDGRTFFAQRVSEFYLLLRMLRFKRLMATVREQVIGGINSALAKGHSSVQFAVGGLLTPDALSQLEREFLSGRESVKSVREKLLGRHSE